MRMHNCVMAATLLFLLLLNSSNARAQTPSTEDRVHHLEAENAMLRQTLEKRNEEIASLKSDVRMRDNRLKMMNRQVQGLLSQMNDVQENLNASQLHVTRLDAELLAVKADAPTSTRWTGFRGIRWGSSVSDVEALQEAQVENPAPDTMYYHRDGDKPSIGKCSGDIVYSFYKGVFDGVIVSAQGWDNWLSLRDAVFAYYDEGHQPDRMAQTWYWGGRYPGGDREVEMRLEYDESSRKATLSLAHKPAPAYVASERARRAQEAAADF